MASLVDSDRGGRRGRAHLLARRRYPYPRAGLRGFGNPAPITVAALYVVARAVDKTAALQPLIAGALGSRGGLRSSLLRLIAPSAVASAFLNNTPIVAMLAPQVRD